MKNILQQSKSFFTETALIFQFTIKFFRQLPSVPFEFRELLKQCYLIGNKSFVLVAITGFIMGLVLTIQARPTLSDFGAESWLPAMVSVSLIREIGPVITALICAGKVGSGIGAELASMRVTEQIDAMEVSGMNPFKYLVVTRVLATMLMIPALVIFADFIGLMGAYIAVNLSSEISLNFYFYQVFEKLDFYDLFPAMIKTVFFGLAIGLVGSYMGYHAEKGTEGVGKAANAAVVVSSLSIFILDLIAVQLTSLLS
jgi:phospholipid/cholesterol/gamma-HCH transport system permease protein